MPPPFADDAAGALGSAVVLVRTSVAPDRWDLSTGLRSSLVGIARSS